MDSRTPLVKSGKLESNAIPLYNRSMVSPGRESELRFVFYRFRFAFQAGGKLSFPAGQGGNLIRGAFGKLLHDAAPDDYKELFVPKAAKAGPSSLADWPRPFLFRGGHLDGLTCRPGEAFSFDVHVFELRRPVLPVFRAAFERWTRARLTGIQTLDLAGQPHEGPCSIPLAGIREGIHRLVIRFVTPTEWKSGGRVAKHPDFGPLFGRIRDRVATLSSLYAGKQLEVDFRSLGERAARVRLVRHDLTWHQGTRKSGRTGQIHPFEGFTGEAEYEGELAEFRPWLEAARWTGVGRQTVWGKGEIHVQ